LRRLAIQIYGDNKSLLLAYEMTKSILISVCLLVSASNCHAWNRGGHLTTGAIAYQELKATNPAVVDRIVEIMNSTPTPLLIKRRLDEESTPDSKAERLFMEMATWPDEVRPPSEYSKAFHHDTWHYINFIYVPPVTPDTFIKPEEVTTERIYEAFARNADIVADPKVSDAEKAVALCWIFHLVGDVHQPLHTTAMFNSEFPEGDRGGNLTKIRVTPTGKVINLHSFWDGAVIGSSNIKAARNKSVKLRTEFPKESLPQLANRFYATPVTFESWGQQESAPLAVSVAYDGGKLLDYSKSDGAYELTQSYVAKAKETADAQLTLAGYRLAAVLAKINLNPN